MTIKRQLFLSLFSIAFTLSAPAQDRIQSKQYPQDYFRYPLDLPPQTAGSFGELRSNHFHSGLDFRTMQRTGFPVHSVADGYISRLRVQYGGFGNAVYITHLNGFTSVYGHLDRIAPELLELVRQQQYMQQKFDVDFELMPLQVRVTKGQVVAWSGNTGASGGPHLHFELRDAVTQETINPNLFGLTIPDKVKPAISRFAIYHLNGRPFSENTFKQTYAVSGSGGIYRPAQAQVFELSGQIGFGISAIDQNSVSPSKNGLYSIQLNVDDKPVFTFAVERFAFDQTHAINGFIDYPNYLRGGGFIQKCFVAPGSRITLFPQAVNKGVITFNDTLVHKVEYVLKDAAGNTSTLNIRVKSSIPKESKPIFRPTGTLLRAEQGNEFNAPGVKLVIAQGNLYDDVDFQYKVLPRKPGTFSPVHQLHNRYTPIHDSIDLFIKPDSTIGKWADKAVIVNGNIGSVGGMLMPDGTIRAGIRQFGDYYLRIDTVPPTISPMNIYDGANLGKASKILLRMGDNLSGIRTWAGKIDGRWVLVERDYKSKILSFTFDQNVGPGRHKFEFTATDYKNNTSTYTANFYR